MNMIKVLWCRFQQCLGTFTILLFQASSETGPFRHLDIHVFTLRNFGNTKAVRVIFFSKCSKFQIYFENSAKNLEKVFCFSDNCIWIGIVKLSLLRRGYFSSVANVLKSIPKIWHVNKKDFFEHNFPSSDQWIWSGCCDGDFNSALTHLPCCFSKGALKRAFLKIYLTTFPEFVISEIQKLWG